MTAGLTVVLDVGKTLSKLSLCDAAGAVIASRSRQNSPTLAAGYLALDHLGIEAWMAGVLRDFGEMGPVGRIVPLAHGAAAAIVRDGRLATPPMDYEQPLPAPLRASYAPQRDDFSHTGSPFLPNGLNLGAQLHHLEALQPDLLGGDAAILPWPQYWAWRLCGVASAEVTSLGCHSDLWRPLSGAPSRLAIRRGWAERLAPVRPADQPLGNLSAEWVQRTGLSPAVTVYCGLHDSNAALLAARGFAEIAEREATVLSTGTWFVAMRTPATAQPAPPDGCDCLLNLDLQARPIPSARFMGGREIERLIADDPGRIDDEADQAMILAATPGLVESRSMIVPTFAPGVGPYPQARGAWINQPSNAAARRATISLYAALVADTALDLIGARERLLIEGRFARAQTFVRALAALRPQTRVFVSAAQNDVFYGALRLVDPTLSPRSTLAEVFPLTIDLGDYRRRWRKAAMASDLAS